MSLLDEYARVSRSRPCPICGHPDWCLVSRDDETNPSKVICARLESKRRFGQAGWLHVLRDDGARWNCIRRWTIRLPNSEADSTLSNLAEEYRKATIPEALSRFASHLGLTAENLQRLRIGWTGEAYSFPMTDPDGRVIGIHLRYQGGIKRSVKGSRLGLFVPVGLTRCSQLVICEGQTDTAAALDLGFQAVGRPGCRSTLQECVELARNLAAPRVVVVGDADEEGRAGADELAAALAVRCRDVRVIYPPEGLKDAREWKQRGATPADVEAAIEKSAPVNLQVRVLQPGARS